MPSSFFLFVLLLLIFLPISLLCFLWCIVRPRPSKIEIRDRHVFISGGSSGIGLAIAHKAAQEGARVSILARDVAKLAQARASVEEATGVRVQTFSADVRNFEEIERVMKEAGPVDVLICNHGIFIPEELEVQSLETMRSMMDINVMGTIHLIKAALPLMKSSSRGSSSAAIAIMSSQAGQVVTDNGSAYKAAGRLIMSHFPQIYWTPCAAHCIDLLLEDFAKIPWIKKVIRRAKYITKFVYAHPHLHHLFCQCSKGKEIIRPSTTRFATNYILLDSLRDAKDALMNTFVSNSWKNDDRFASLRRTPEAHNSLAIIFDCVEKPGKFWFEVLNVIEVTEPLVKVLRKVDGERPSIAFVYEAMFRAREAIRSYLRAHNLVDRFSIISTKFYERWNGQLHNDLHAAAHILNPRYGFGKSFDNNDDDVQLKIGLENVLDKLVSDPIERVQVAKDLDMYRKKWVCHLEGLLQKTQKAV